MVDYKNRTAPISSTVKASLFSLLSSPSAALILPQQPVACLARLFQTPWQRLCLPPPLSVSLIARRLSSLAIGMGAKAKKLMKKNLSKVTSQLSVLEGKKESADFLPLEGGPGRKLPVQKPLENTATVVYVGRIPHGFYEKEMEGFFSQFGEVRRLRIARNKKTGKSKHFGFIEFGSPEVAKIVADSMHNYLLYEHILKIHLIPPEHVHPKLWKGFNYRFKPLNWVQIERKNHNKDRSLEEHKKLLERIVKRDQIKRKRIKAADIDYECPEIVGSAQPAPKKIKFDED